MSTLYDCRFFKKGLYKVYNPNMVVEKHYYLTGVWKAKNNISQGVVIVTTPNPTRCDEVVYAL